VSGSVAFLDQWRTASDIAEEIRMLAGAAPRKTQVLVEGEDDLKLYERLLDASKCQVVAASTRDAKRRVLEVARLLRTQPRRKVQAFLGIIDTDFDELLGKKRTDQCIVYTDGYSLESMLVRHCRWDAITSELRLALEPDFLQRVLCATGEVGLLRLASMMEAWGLRFKGLDVCSFVDPVAITVDLEALTAAAVDNTPGARVEVHTVRRKLADGKCRDYDPWHLCNGHDLVAILASTLRARTNPTKAFVTPPWLAGVLRMTHDERCFSGTRTYYDLLKWEEAHRPFAVLFGSGVERVA